jgi:hypothetical protein
MHDERAAALAAVDVGDVAWVAVLVISVALMIAPFLLLALALRPTREERLAAAARAEDASG